MSDASAAPFEKEVVRLPDGRQLIYYRFPEAPPAGASTSAAPAPVPAPKKER
jgi:hypothetical protein